MERIWAPWRMEYITNAVSEEGCIICLAANTAHDRERLVLCRGEHTITMLNRYPYTNGHLMVAPKRHVPGLDDLLDPELLGLMHAIRQAKSLLQQTCRPDGFNIGINLGKAAGAGIEEHLHIHLVPRWVGDSNFMTVVGDIRVIPEGLMESYDHLFAALKGNDTEGA